jgi:2-polyprenyl-6-methoxyphenol hydroxylase-like FAD-dependent oxidoreductase
MRVIVVADAAELKLPRLGYMVENNVLQLALWQALEAHPKVTLRVPASLGITSSRRVVLDARQRR